MNNISRSQEKIHYKMCNNQSCCPILSEIEDNKFTITDDYEGKVLLTRDELKLLKTFLNDNLKD
jgi:hypothetical protein